MFNFFKPENATVDDVSKNKIFVIGTYAVLGLVSLFMTIMNIVTDKGLLTYSTGAFSVLCIKNIVLSCFGEKASKVAKYFFSIEVLLMFTFFLMSGNPEGFSAIWICILPSFGMFFFDRIKGTVLCFLMFFILVFFLWTSFGRSLLMYNYTESFKMRFPILFVAFHILAFFLESLRVGAYKEMQRMQEYYKNLSAKDQLTGVFNRQGMYSAIEDKDCFTADEKIGVAMFDIDDFKKINDIYGHNAGDVVLKGFAEILSETKNSVICRWGGEEFVIIFENEFVPLKEIEEVRIKIENHKFVFDENVLNVTSSIGVYNSDSPNVKLVDSYIEKADEALYKAKNSGKNQVVVYDSI